MVHLRKMMPQDRDAVLGMLSETKMFTPEEIAVAMELVDIFLTNEKQKDYTIFVAQDENDQAIGYVCYGATPATEGTFDLYWIAVSPKNQNQGIGKKLLNFTENQVLEQNGRLIIIETSSQPKYAPTQQFYLKNNYTIEARIKDFYRIGDDRLIFIKRINS